MVYAHEFTFPLEYKTHEAETTALFIMPVVTSGTHRAFTKTHDRWKDCFDLLGCYIALFLLVITRCHLGLCLVAMATRAEQDSASQA